jgi:hypothetical protein
MLRMLLLDYWRLRRGKRRRWRRGRGGLWCRRHFPMRAGRCNAGGDQGEGLIVVTQGRAHKAAARRGIEDPREFGDGAYNK